MNLLSISLYSIDLDTIKNQNIKIEEMLNEIIVLTHIPKETGFYELSLLGPGLGHNGHI